MEATGDVTLRCEVQIPPRPLQISPEVYYSIFCGDHTRLQELWSLQVRTVSVVLVWIAAALLILNYYLRSEWPFLLSIASIVFAVLIYLIPFIRVGARAQNIQNYNASAKY